MVGQVVVTVTVMVRLRLQASFWSERNMSVCVSCDHNHLLHYTTHIHSKAYASACWQSLSFPLLISSPCVKGSYLGVSALAQPNQAWLLVWISPQEQHVPKDSTPLTLYNTLLLTDFHQKIDRPALVIILTKRNCSEQAQVVKYCEDRNLFDKQEC